MDDNAIIDLFFSRDESAISETAGKYGAYCFTVANNILGDSGDAEECLNEAWFRAWSCIPPQRPEKLRLFLVRLVRSAALDRVRAQKAQKRGGGETELALEELKECLAGTADVESEVLQRERSELIRGFVHGLPEKERTVFVRRYFFLDSVRDIARLLGTSEGSVMTRLSRTRKKLRNLLEKELNDND